MPRVVIALSLFAAACSGSAKPPSPLQNSAPASAPTSSQPEQPELDFSTYEARIETVTDILGAEAYEIDVVGLVVDHCTYDPEDKRSAAEHLESLSRVLAKSISADEFRRYNGPARDVLTRCIEQRDKH